MKYITFAESYFSDEWLKIIYADGCVWEPQNWILVYKLNNL